MSTITCQNGHDSTDSDFCSVCSEEIRPASAQTAVPASVPQIVGAKVGSVHSAGNPVVAGQCPDCKEPHGPDDGQFCETCGFDFVAGQPGIPGVTSTTADLAANVSPQVISAPVDVVAPANPVVDVVGSGSTSSPVAAVEDDRAPVKPLTAVAQPFRLLVEVDDSLLPAGSKTQVPRVPPRTYDISASRAVLGRTAQPGVDIVVTKDPAISGKQLEFILGSAGYKVKDLGSSNGTRLEGEAERLEPHAEYPLDRPLQDGDILYIGEFTRVTILQLG